MREDFFHEVTYVSTCPSQMAHLYILDTHALFLTPPWTKDSNTLELEIDLNSS